mmetsp:Transcript_28831/g.82596  ORF Transcript_28831/g.82596 Transcript_28831/m.82596 type:complete len:297 (-) Transcript_28831:1070-1960(-)
MEEEGKTSVRHVRLSLERLAKVILEGLTGPQPAEELRARLLQRAKSDAVEAAIPYEGLRPARLPLLPPPEVQAAIQVAIQPRRSHLHDLLVLVQEDEPSQHKEILDNGAVLGAERPVLQEVRVLLHLLPVRDRVRPGELHGLRRDVRLRPLLLGQRDLLRRRALRCDLLVTRAAHSATLNCLGLHHPMKAAPGGLRQHYVIVRQRHLHDAQRPEALGEPLLVDDDVDREPVGQVLLLDPDDASDARARGQLLAGMVELLGGAHDAGHHLRDLQQVGELPIARDLVAFKAADRQGMV